MLLIPLFAAVTFAGQGPDSGPPHVSPPPTASRATAVLAVRAPVIDGRDDDDVWRQAAPITEFRGWQPGEDGPPRFPTMPKGRTTAPRRSASWGASAPPPARPSNLWARR